MASLTWLVSRRKPAITAIPSRAASRGPFPRQGLRTEAQTSVVGGTHIGFGLSPEGEGCCRMR